MLILASKSPARRALLAGTGLDFRCRAADIDERRYDRPPPAAGADPLAADLAAAKAVAVSRDHPRALVIGADQTLCVDANRLHKPADITAARARLQRLRGRAHTLTSATALARAGEIVWHDAEVATLEMRAATDAEIDAVIALEGDRLCDSVGAYRLEGASVRLFAAIEGDYFAILGLPLLSLLDGLRRHAPDIMEVRP